MSTMPQGSSQVKTVAALQGVLEAAGYQPGWPGQITPRTFAIDRRTCSRLLCPGCRRRGMKARPFRKGSRYRLLAWCPSCLAAEER